MVVLSSMSLFSFFDRAEGKGGSSDGGVRR